MARNQLLNSLSFDPALYGIDDSFWKVVSGTPAIAGSNIRISAAELKAYRTFRFGGYRMTVNVPTAPTGGDAREWGLENAALGETARFEIAGTVFKAVTIDKDGNSTSTTIVWDATWHTADVLYEIVWRENYVQFLVAGDVKATHERADNRPIFPMNLYIHNTNADNFDIVGIEVSEADIFNPANLINVELSEADIEIGAVELKNESTDDRALIGDANVARAATDHVLVVQHVDAAGDVLTEATQVSIFGDTTTIAGDTTSMDAKMPALGTAAMAASVPVTLATDDTQFGAVGAASLVDGGVHAQLRFIGEAVDGLEPSVFVDESAFTLGTSSGQPVFGQYTAAGDDVADGETGVLAMAIDRHLLVQTDGYDSGTDSQKVYEVSPVSEKHVEGKSVLTNVANASPAEIYLDMDGARNCAFQFIKDAGADTFTVTADVTLRDDGTAPVSITEWEDIGLDWFGVASWTADDFLMTQDGVVAKYVKLTITTAGGNNDADFTVYTKKLY